MRDPTYGSIPQAARRFGLGVKLLRGAVDRGEIASYTAGTKRVRVSFAEVEVWLRATRVRPTAHAERRVAQVLAAEGRSAANGGPH